MKVERAGRVFDVEDGPLTAWGFWSQFTNGWETETLAALDRLTDDTRDYLDIGAWVGPTVLWAAPLARRCVAVEPDPVALDVLRLNVERNCSNVTVVPVAVAAEEGTAELETGGSWGDSMSSLQRRSVAETVTVQTVTLDSLLTDLDPAVMKIDIEGGEGLMLPPNEELLHDMDCPILLSVHWPWLPLSQAEEVRRVIKGFRCEILDANPHFPTVLLG